MRSGVACGEDLPGLPADVGPDPRGPSSQIGIDAIKVQTFAALFGKRTGLRTPSSGYRNMLPRPDVRAVGRGAEKEAPARSQSMLEALATLDTLEQPSVILVSLAGGRSESAKTNLRTFEA